MCFLARWFRRASKGYEPLGAPDTMGSNKSPLESLVSLQDYLRVRVRSATERDAAGEWRDIEIGKALDAGVNGGPGNVLRYGADPTGVADSTAAFNAAALTGNAYVPIGSYRIDTTIACDKEVNFIFERGTLPNYRYWANPGQAPFDFTAGRQCRLFKDNSSSDVPFFKIRWGGVRVLGFPLLDVHEKTSFTSAGMLYAGNESNPNSSNGAIRGWYGQGQIMSTLARE